MKTNRKIIYLAGFLFSIPIALVSYLNSSFLKTFVGEDYIGALYIIASILTIGGFLKMPKVLNRLGNQAVSFWLSFSILISLILLAFCHNEFTAIFAFQILVSTFVMKFKPLNAMIGGIFISAIGVGLWFVTQNSMFLFISIMIFSFGEMASSPKISEYIGRIAPKDKVAMYMGLYYLPIAGGNLFAGILSGRVYTNMSDKITLLKIEIAARGIQLPEISKEFTQNNFINKAASSMHMTNHELTNYLWNTYHPSNIWVVFSGIGVATAILLLLYDKLILKSKSER